MAKPKTKSSSHARTTAKTGKHKKSAPRVSALRGGPTKRERVLGMLRSKSGTTADAIVRVTGWQPHSVRGFFAGVVKKKLGLSLTSVKTSSGRVYRVMATKPRPANRPETVAEPTHA